MEDITALLNFKYRSGNPAAYYQDMSAHNDLSEQLYSQNDQRSTSLVCGPLSGNDIEEKRNIVQHSDVVNFLSAFTDTRCINQLPYYARFNADDPRDFPLKLQVFYFSRIARCERILLRPNWEKSVGTQEEVTFARKIGKPIYELTLPESSVTLTEAAA